MNSAAVPGIDAARRRRQLPVEVSAFVGREGELGTLAGLLRCGRHVTVTGPGGVGKTRLALRAAAGLADRYPDGSCLVELSELPGPAGTDAGLVPTAIAQCLGLRGHDPRSTHAAVLDHLRGKRLLLILDTCEHLTAACAQFAAQLLRTADGVAILATSRQPLHAAGEQVLRLGPLPVPGAGRGPAPGDAVELFAKRAAAALPGFAVTNADLPDVIRLCRRLDGIPLAIELAAVRVRALPLAELAERLEARFSVLTGARRGTVPRQQTLRAAIEWSYGLCTEAEQTVWNRLSVFAGSFDLAAARDVAACPQVPEDQVGDVLAGLADKSVVLRAGDTRFRLLGSEREYAAERLTQSGQEAECRRRHARRYLKMARSLGQHFLADDQAARLRRLRAEHAELSAVLGYGFAAGDPGWERDAARLTGALFPYWLLSGLLREGIHWQDQILARFREPSAERANALANRATLGAMLGLPESAANARAGITVAAAAGDDRAQARGYLALQLALGLRSAYPQALEAANEARRRLTALGADVALRCLDVQLAQTHQIGGDLTAAAAAGQRALAGLGPGERWLHGHVLIISALALYRLPGRQTECARAAGGALRAMRDLSNPVGEACALDVLGWLAADAGRCQRAAWLLGAAQTRWQRSGGRQSGTAVMAGYHKRSAAAAARALGPDWYAELHARGASLPRDQVVELAAAGGDTVPDGPRPGVTSLSGRPLLGVPGPRATLEEAAAIAPRGRPAADELTGRELEIAGLVALGLANRDIANRLFISRRTVDAHINHIFAKLGLSSRVQLAIWARDRAPGGQPGGLPPGAPSRSAGQSRARSRQAHRGQAGTRSSLAAEPPNARGLMAAGTTDRISSTLPTQATGFVGRRRELANLDAVLDDDARLITVTGAGGVGKTRLAVQAAAHASGRYPDGVFLVELSPLRDPGLLAATVAARLGLPAEDDRPQLAALLDYLRDRTLLLILDTCEHLVDACAKLADVVLREAPGVTVLATSRQPLDVAGENAFLLSPLPVPGPGAAPADPADPADPVADSDAVVLFAQRAAAVVDGFTVTDANRAQVIGLCRALDGIPLGIELAAVRLRALPLDEMARHLDDRFRVLTGGKRAGAERHHTLRAAIEWSYELCTRAEQLLWARLSVFAGTFDLAAAEEVCAGGELDRAEMVETLVGLVEKSVLAIQADATAGPAAAGACHPQYRMLDTIRQFGADHLAGTNAEAVTQSRLVAHYLAMAQRWGRDPMRDQLAQYRALSREHANLRAAMEYALDLAGNDSAAVTIATSLMMYWRLSGQLREGEYWLNRVLERCPRPSPAGPGCWPPAAT